MTCARHDASTARCGERPRAYDPEVSQHDERKSSSHTHHTWVAAQQTLSNFHSDPTHRSITHFSSPLHFIVLYATVPYLHLPK